MIVFGISLFYVGYKFHNAYRNIEMTREKIGYKSPSKNLPGSIFKKGKWKGIIIDTEISYTDCAHNLIPYDLDNDGNIELIADFYRSGTLIFYKFEINPSCPKNWSRYVIDFSVWGTSSKRSIKTIIEVLAFYKS